MGTISIVIPVLNGAATIGRALDSLIAQTTPDWQAFVIDDGSTDGTASIVAAYAQKDARISSCAFETNKGVSAARNKALALAQGAWLTLLDADDWFEPPRLEKLLAAAQALKADAVLDNLKIFDHATGHIVDETRFGTPGKPERITIETLFEKDTPFSRHAIGYAQPFVNLSFLREKDVTYDESLRLGEDFAFLAELLLKGAAVFALPDAYYVYVHRISPSSGATSPFSRSSNDAAQVFAFDESFLAKHGARLSPRARHAVVRRMRLFARLLAARRLRDSVKAKAFRRSLKELAQPAVLVFLARYAFLKALRCRRCAFLRRWDA